MPPNGHFRTLVQPRHIPKNGLPAQLLANVHHFVHKVVENLRFGVLKVAPSLCCPKAITETPDLRGVGEAHGLPSWSEADSSRSNQRITSLVGHEECSPQYSANRAL